MSKLHELLAVDSNMKKQAESTRADLMNTFDKKKNHFTERIVTFEPIGDGAPPPSTEEQLDLQTTVAKELAWISDHLARSIDVSYQVAEANTSARADVVLETGEILLKSMPATSLLELEKRAAEVREFVGAIPTLDPAKGFQPDASRGANIYVARDSVRVRTAKIQEPLTLAPATDKHPAQVQLVSKDVPTGNVKTREWSGMLTTAQKGDMIDRVEALARAIKKARARANEAEIDPASYKIGKTLLSYVFDAKLP
jgi:hypothetical protein